MARTPEARVKHRVVQVLKQHGAWYCFPATYGRGRSGVPDILACHKGAFIAVECKAGNNQPTQLQDIELKSITKAGGWSLVVNEDLVQELSDLLTLITDLAERNKQTAAANYAAALKKMEEEQAEDGTEGNGNE